MTSTTSPARSTRRQQADSRLQRARPAVEAQMETRSGGAGPTDCGMLWIEGYPVTAPTGRSPPVAVRAAPEDDGYGIYRDGCAWPRAPRQRRPASTT
jgi:hypothetical protein